MPQRFADRCAPRGTRRHTAVATASVLAAAYAALTAVLVVAGLLLTHALPSVARWDEHGNQWVAARRTGLLTMVSDGAGYLADTLGVAVVATVVTAVLLLRRRGRLALLVPAGLALELAVFLSTNYTVGRPRPTVPHLGHTPSTASFPSGHVAATLVLYGGIAVLVRARGCRPVPQAVAWAAALVFPLLVAFSRVYQGQHHPLDVLAGLAMGLGALVAAILAIRTSLTPAPAPTVTARGDVAQAHSTEPPAVTVAPTIGANR